MNLNHVGLAVTEVPETAHLLQTYFGMTPVPFAPSNSQMAFLTDDNGALLTMFKANDASYPKLFHLGFMRESVEDVDAIHERLTAGGYHPEAPREEFGRWTFYFQSPGGFTIEVNAHLPHQQ